LRRELDSWPRDSVVILTTTTGRAWTANNMTHAVSAALKPACRATAPRTEKAGGGVAGSGGLHTAPDRLGYRPRLPGDD
jgi:hypothetical protein